MGATLFATQPSSCSVAKQVQRVLLVLALFVTASASSWAQNITVSVASVTFPKTIIGVTSAAKVVTITNKGGSAQAVNLVMSGDFSETDNCGGSIGSGLSCQANLFFTPTLVGSISGAAGIYDSGNNLLAFVGLTGTSAVAVTTTPTSLSFTGGTIGVQSAAKTFTINNTSSIPVNITAITTNIPDYQINTGICLTTTVAPAGNCTVSVQVTPTSASANGAIIITDDAPSAVPLVVKLASSAMAVTNPISASPASLTFKTASGGSSAAQTITLKNISSGPVTLGTITVGADYAISSNTCSTTLAVKNSTCTFSIQFQPAFVGVIEGTAAVPFTTSNNNSPLVVNLTGTSLAPLTIAPAKLTFATQSIGTTSAAQPVTITNNGTSAAALNSIVPSADFQIQPSGTTCSLSAGTLAGGSSCIVEIQFAPTVGGSIVGGLTVSNNASPSPLLIPFSGTAAGFTLTAAPTSVSVMQGNSNTSTITVHPTNGFAGSVSLAVTSTLPNGVTAAFNPTSTSSTSVLTLTASATATIGGPIAVAVTGTSGGLSQTTTINLTVTSGPNFTLTAAPSTLSIAQGGSKGSTIAVHPSHGFTGSVNLAVTSTLPTGVTASFNPTSTTSTSVLTLTASASATVGGPVAVTVTGTSGALTQTTTINLTVTASKNFSLSAAPSTLSIVQGSNGTSTITVNPISGFTGSVSLAVTSTLPTGVTAAFNPTSTTSTSVLTLTASGTATVGGPVAVTVTGTSGTLSHTTTINLTVTPSQNFTLSAAPGAVSVVQGGNGTSTITVNPTNGFAGSVTLGASGLPSGVTAGFGTNPTTGTSLLTLTASGSATVGGPTTVTITGTSGSLVQTTTISLTVTAPPNFTLSAAPGTVSIVQGSNGTSTITVNPTNGFSGNVNLAASGLPSGVTAGFGTNPTTGTSLLTLTASGSATVGGPTTVTITGTSGSLVQTTTISLTVTAPPNFTLSAAPGSLSIAQGSNGTSTITVNPTNGFAGNVNLAASGLPSGVTAGFGTNPTTGTSLLTLTASGSATVGGPTTVTITGTSGSLVQTTTVSLTVTAAPNFTLSAAPGTVSIAQGGNGTSTITVNPTNGFAGNVNLAASGLPSGVTAGFGTNPTTGTSLLTLTASGSATVGGPTTVTITGTSGSLVQTTTVSLTVTAAPNFTLSAAPGTVSIVQGGNGTSTITVNPTNGFAGNVNLAASGLPSGVTAGFGTNPTTGTSLLTLTASGSATVGGPMTVTITGTSGSLVQTTTVSLTVTAAPNFTLSAAPGTVSIAQGGNGTSTITVNPTNGFAGNVNLAASGLPSGVMAGFGTNPTTGTSLLTLTASGSATVGGPTTVTVTGTSGSLVQTTTVSLTVTGGGPSAVLTPASGHQGSNQTIVITGSGTNFTSSTTASFGVGFAQGLITVNGPTSASIPVTIGNNAAVGSHNVTITTGSQVVTATFTVIAGVPAVATITPNNIAPTQSSTSVSITGVFTHWASGTTKANFGPGIKVGSAAAGTFGTVTVNNATTLTANISSSNAAPGPRTIQIQTGTQTLTVPNGMFVETCATTAPTVVQITPADGSSNALLDAPIRAQFSMPMSSTNFTLGATAPVFLSEATNPTLEVPGTLSLDPSNTIMTITPNKALIAGDQYTLILSNLVSKPYVYLQDACGNNLPPQGFSFNTAYSIDTTGPTLTGTSPVNGDTNIPTSGASSATPVVLQFDTPIDPITAQTGFSLLNGVNAVPGSFTYSVDDRTVTFTPASALTANTTYAVNYSSQITDAGGNLLNNPGSFSFTTGSASDTVNPSVTLVDPPNGTFGVGLNVLPRVTFSEAVDGATLPSALSLVYADTGVIIPATVTITANRRTATVTPSAPLLPNTYYNISLPGSSYTDLAGNPGSGSSTYFFTGTSAYTTALTVTTINPTNGQTVVPTNARITAVMSNNVDPTTITNSSITVTPSGGSAITGTVTLANDGVTLTFVPSGALTASKVYNVAISGFADIDGNAVTAFASSFTTGSSSYGGGSFTLVSTSPVNGATGVSVTSAVTFTMSNLINAASVNPNTVYVKVNNSNAVVAGTYSVVGAAVTFTPLASTPYPANTQMGMCINGLTDEAGNAAGSQCFSFTTASTADTTPPTVSITPANGTTNVGLNTQVVLAFSKSINPSTITPTTLTLFNGDAAINYGYSISRDNRTIVLNPSGNAFAAGATITVALSSGVQDLSGNSLANTSSQFTLTTALSNSAPTVLEMRPANGATDVPVNTVVTLFTNAAMNPATIAGALYVADNGVVVTGAVQLFSNGQAIEFTPSASFKTGDTIQVSLDSTALSSTNVPLSSFSGQFVVADIAGVVQQTNPFPNATNVPLNTIIQVEYDQALDPTTISSGNISLAQDGSNLSPTITLVGTQVINIAPTSPLNPGSNYVLKVNGTVKGTDGTKVNGYQLNFTAGAAADNAAPTIVSLAPADNSTNIGTNAAVSVTFNKTMNPVSVNGNTIKLSVGATAVPASISFPNTTSGAFNGSPDYTRVSITPLAPLPPNTVMTVAINGVTSEAGKLVATSTTHFTTQALPDYSAPFVVNPSVQDGQTNVPVNSVFALQFSKAMDLGSIDVANIGVSANGCNLDTVPATISWSADQTTISIVPSSPLAVGTQYFLFSYSMTDLAGNPQQDFCTSSGFTTSFIANNTPPTVVNTSPENVQTQVPVNAPVQILFSEPVNPATIGQVTLQTGGNAVSVIPTFSDANQLLTLTPALTLLANANYTLTITGVKDTAGNQMAGTVTNTFTTGAAFDLLKPAVTLADPPAGATGVGTNVAPRIVFNKRLNPLSIVSSSNEPYNQGSVELYNNATSHYVPATVSMSADRLTATITPSSALQPNTSYQIYVGSSGAFGANYYDVAGNAGASYSGGFVTASSSDTLAAAVSTISPANNQTGVPLNAQIIALMNDQIDPTRVTSGSITVTPSGGSAVAGTVTLASDGITLTFVPSGALTASKVYNVSVGGFKDLEGNTVTPFSSSFTTGSSTYGGGFNVLSTSPANSATGVSVSSAVTFTMNNLINAASVNPNTVYVFINSTSQVMAGNYNVSGAAVTFTPLAQYPANTLMGMCVNGLKDEAGNAAASQCYSFTTANTADNTPPTVTISPANGVTNAGLNTQVVLTFSKSINPATINASSVNLLNGDVPLNPATSISRDNRTVILNYTSSTLPAGATITVAATHLITDLSGNALADTISQFTTTPAVLNAAPTVVNMRPSNGATFVPFNTVITLFTNAPMNGGSLPGALHISQNGVLVAGTTSVSGNGQSIQFTPSSALSAGASIQVFLDSTAQDIYGNSLASFSGSFTTAGSLTNTHAVVQAVNPAPGASNVPLNTIIQIEYNQPLDPTTVISPAVTFCPSPGTCLTPTLSVTGNGQVINIAPTSNLAASTTYSAQVILVTNVDSVPVQRFTLTFTTGTATDTVAPNVLTVAPPDSATNIGTNAGVSVNFNKPVNPVSVSGSSIQLSGGSVTAVPSSISFTPDYSRTIIVPQAPLPSNTQMAIAINGVTSVAGTAVASQTTHFTTMAGPDFIPPYVVNSSVQSGQTVGDNAAFAMQFNKPMDQGSVDGALFGISSVACYATPVTATVSWSGDQTAIFVAPTNPLTDSTTYYLYSQNLMDLSGNSQTTFCVTFSTGIGSDTTGPVVQQVSPPSGFTGVPINAPVQILFNEPISGASLGGVTLQQGSTIIPTTVSLYDGNLGVQLLPLVPLAPGTVYTINVTGVMDITGNPQSSFPSQSFTTGSGIDLVAPAVVSTIPSNGQTSVPVGTSVQVVFNEAMDAASFDPNNNSFTLTDALNNVVPATITFSVDYKTATLQPMTSLTGGGKVYKMYVSHSSIPPLQDLGGNSGNPLGTSFSFTTQ
jgi:hypothetical protein